MSMKIDHEPQPGASPTLPVMEVREAIGLYIPMMDRLLTRRSWGRRTIDQVIIPNVPQESDQAGWPRRIVQVGGTNGDFKCLTNAVLRESVPALAAAWGYDLAKNPQIRNYQRNEGSGHSFVITVVNEEQYPSSQYKLVDLVLQHIFRLHNGELLRKDLVLRRHFPRH